MLQIFQMQICRCGIIPLIRALTQRIFVFAVSVDTKFSVADSMADEAENYETYSKLMFPMLAGAIFGSVLWLIGMVWLTVTAGRKPEDEEIHLNGFDRWYTEIAAGSVIGIWLAGMIISGNF